MESEPNHAETTSRGQTIIREGQNGPIQAVRPAPADRGQAGQTSPSSVPINQTPTSAPAPPPKKK